VRLATSTDQAPSGHLPLGGPSKDPPIDRQSVRGPLDPELDGSLDGLDGRTWAF
jgi:hypothetical protein